MLSTCMWLCMIRFCLWFECVYYAINVITQFVMCFVLEHFAQVQLLCSISYLAYFNIWFNMFVVSHMVYHFGV